jgi:hypothetical protein
MNNLDRYKIYKSVFGGKNGKIVMDDLESFCCYNYSTNVRVDNVVDVNAMQQQEGKRQALLYIKSCLIEPKELPVQKIEEEEF